MTDHEGAELADVDIPGAADGPRDAPLAPQPVADLLLYEVAVRNFRNLVDIRVPIDSSVTYLVGENNTGKSSLLLAIETATGGRRATGDDLHRDAAGEAAAACWIDLILRSAGDTFSDPVGQRFGMDVSDGPEAGEWYGIRCRLEASQDGWGPSTRRIVLRWDVATESWNETGAAVPPRALELLHGTILDAARDLTDEQRNRTSAWGRLMSDLGVPDADRPGLETDLADLAGKLHGASPVFGEVKARLEMIARAQLGVDDVALRPLPMRLEELGQSTEVVVSAAGRADLPLRLQGHGSRSLAAIMVFAAVSDLRTGIDQGVRPHLLMLLEEPEAHLHPQAQAAVRRLLNGLGGQVIVSTHSTHIIAECDPRAVRIFRCPEGAASVKSLDLEVAKKIAVFRRYVERPLGELFFARMAVFVDGTAERTSLPVMLTPLLGGDPAGFGVTFIDCEGMKHDQLEKAAEALAEMGPISWLAFVDNDGPGHDAIMGITGSDGVALAPGHGQVVMSGAQQLERALVNAGLTDEIQEVANTYQPRTAEDPLYPALRLEPYASGEEEAYLRFLANAKGWAAELVARLAVDAGRKMPDPVIELALRIRTALGIPEPTDAAYVAASGTRGA